MIGFGIGSGIGDIDCRFGDKLILSNAGDALDDCAGDVQGGEYGGGGS
jgi:hypothetical protein